MVNAENIKRSIPLEALRGFAAIGVVFHHFALGFLPNIINLSSTTTVASPWIGSPLFLLINGKAMVIVFFVLSGYVLTLKGTGLRTKSELAFESSKRWLRLTPAVSLSLLVSSLLFAFHLYHYDDVSALNGSRMFQHYGGYAQNDRPGFSAFVFQALLGNTFLGEFNLNPVLWTMMPEFYGSILVFMLAFVLHHGERVWFFLIFLFCLIAMVREGVWFVPFLLGVLGAALNLKNRKLSKVATFFILSAALYLCGFYRPEGWYGWLAVPFVPELSLRILVTTAGGFGLLVIFATDNAVSRHFTGLCSQVLGKMSFALYLIHLLILTSASAWGYAVFGGGSAGIITAATLFVLTAAPLTYIVALFDNWWLKILSGWRLPAKRP